MANPFLAHVHARTISRKRKMLLLAVAATIDIARLLGGGEIGFLDPLDDIADVAMAALLVAMVGFQWQVALGFMVELIPGLAVFPTWTALVLTLPVQQADDLTVREGSPLLRSGAA